MKTKRKVIVEMVINIAGIPLNVVDGQVNMQDQSPEGQELMRKISSAINGQNDTVSVNLEPLGAGAGMPETGMPEAGMPEAGMPETGMPDPMAGGETPTDIQPIGGGAPEQDVDMNPDTDMSEPFDEPSDETSNTGDTDNTENSDTDEDSDTDSNTEDEDSDKDDDKDDSDKAPPFKKKEKADESIRRIASLISEDIRVCNGKMV